jgi:hypothetical protein
MSGIKVNIKVPSNSHESISCNKYKPIWHYPSIPLSVILGAASQEVSAPKFCMDLMSAPPELTETDSRSCQNGKPARSERIRENRSLPSVRLSALSGFWYNLVWGGGGVKIRIWRAILIFVCISAIGYMNFKQNFVDFLLRMARRTHIPYNPE